MATAFDLSNKKAFPEFIFLLISLRSSFQFVVPKYLSSEAFSNDL
jgi:hypothetical protein